MDKSRMNVGTRKWTGIDDRGVAEHISTIRSFDKPGPSQ